MRAWVEESKLIVQKKFKKKFLTFRPGRAIIIPSRGGEDLIWCDLDNEGFDWELDQWDADSAD